MGLLILLALFSLFIATFLIVISAFLKLSATLFYIYYRFFASEETVDEAYRKKVLRKRSDYRAFEKELDDLLG